jgi:hypothetical protein
MEDSWTLREWVMVGVFCISVLTLAYTIISTSAIRGNDLKHISETLKDIVSRIERLENLFMKGKKDG